MMGIFRFSACALFAQFSHGSGSLVLHDRPAQDLKLTETCRRLNFLLFSFAFGFLINLDVEVTDEKENGDGKQIKITVGRDLRGENRRQEQNLEQIADAVRNKYVAESGAKAEEEADADAEDEDGDEDEDEDDLVPEIMPDDALFIPLGLAHQRPQTYYKGTDPEWQSFLEFASDHNRSYQVRSRSS